MCRKASEVEGMMRMKMSHVHFMTIRNNRAINDVGNQVMSSPLGNLILNYSTSS